MAKTQAPAPPRSAPAPTTPADWNQASSWAWTIRETIESIVIAFILAFLFRTFEVEAFVIPTGSMATTLMGRHLDVDCPACKFHFQVGVPDEDSARQQVRTFVCPSCGHTVNLPQFTILSVSASKLVVDDKSGRPAPYEIVASCTVTVDGEPGKISDLRAGDNVGFNLNADGDVVRIDRLHTYTSYNGDRILVSKLAYDFAEPTRWDVFVFKYPEDAKTNYIKRLIGLPNEILRIREGDVEVSHDGGKTFAFPQRTPAKIRAMLRMVYDNDFVFEKFLQHGWPAAWHDATTAGQASWTNEKAADGSLDPKVFVAPGGAASGGSSPVAWLRFTHYLPSGQDWSQFENNQPFTPPQPELITDFVAYDASNRGQFRRGPLVDDLAVECTVDVAAAHGKLALELLKKDGHSYQCVLDLAAGTAELVLPDLPADQRPRAAGCISRAGTYHLELANVDRRLTLWVDDRPIQFDRPADYQPARSLANAHDFVSGPVGIGSQDAALRVSHVRVLRDIYYTYEDNGLAHPNYFQAAVPPGWPSGGEWFCWPGDGYRKLAAAGTDVEARDQYFFLGPDQFFALGDNSQLSQDGRLWTNEHFVDRRLLIGKALFIFWPHSFDRVSIFGHNIPLPFWPNFSRMGFVR